MEPAQIRQLLEKQSFFQGLADNDLEWIACSAVEQRFEPGVLVARHGTQAECFFLVLEGALMVEIPALAGPSLEVTRLGPGQIFGWSWLIEPFRWHFNARAAIETRVLEFDGRAILERCERDSAFGYLLLKRFSALMGARLEAAQRKMMDQWAPAGLP